jgi:peptidyl-prolyl cis-trans isomerase B (cyclophilin B)
MIATLLALLPLCAGGPEVRWNASGTYVVGQPYKVQVEITAPKDGTVVSSWLLSPAAFTIDGKALAKREDSGTLHLPAGFTITGSVDLGAHIKASGEFKLGYASEIADTPPVNVRTLEAAPGGLNFMTMPVEELGKYLIFFQTNRGDILVRMWPHIAPEHSRNYLDLAYINFYDGTTFHRIIPGFMIQGGDPDGSGSGNGPRTLKAEFNPAVKHLRGVLSAARTNDPNSASCQFFIMHGTAAHLDGQYSAFGETVLGLDVVDAIVNSPKGPGDKPKTPQKIERAIVVKMPSWVDPNPSQTASGPNPVAPTPTKGK